MNAQSLFFDGPKMVKLKIGSGLNADYENLS
ncbi:MAG: hypothetical protein JMDDDDMK_02144 [Acidobacteria bacterium]|nr:hypothetical protein [Acidobacteriota bacterium]